MSETTGMNVCVPLAALADLCPDGLVAFDEIGRLLLANAAFYQLVGVNSSQTELVSEREFDRWMGSVTARERAYAPLAACPSNSADLLYLQVPQPCQVRRTVRRVPSHGRQGLLCLVHLRLLSLVVDAEPPATPSGEVLGGLLQRLADGLAMLRGGARQNTLPDVQITPMSLTVLVQQVLDQLPAAARERPLYIEPVPAGQVLVAAAAVAAAMRELARNAVLASPPGSGLHLSWRRRTFAGQDQIGLALGDHGSGMHQVLLAEAGTGGSGLARARRLMALQGGELELFSQMGVGTRACLWLPLAPGEPESAQPPFERDQRPR